MRHGKGSREAGLSQEDNILIEGGLYLEILAFCHDSPGLTVINPVESDNAINHN